MTWCARIGVCLALLSVQGCNRDGPNVVPIRPAFEQSYRQGAMSVTMTVTRTNLAMAGKVNLALAVQVPSGPEIDFPSVDESVDSFFLLASHDEILSTPENGQLIQRREWVLAPSVPGIAMIPALAVECGADRVITDPLSIHVESVLPPGRDDLELRDIAGPVTELPGFQDRMRTWLPAAAVLLLVLPAIIVLYLATRKRVVELSPHEAAFRALDQLPETGVARIHALNRILRQYLERRFHLRMIGKTAQEIIPALEHSALLVQRPRLVEFFEQGDQVRFSNVVRPGFLDEAERFVIGYIKATTPREES